MKPANRSADRAEVEAAALREIGQLSDAALIRDMAANILQNKQDSDTELYDGDGHPRALVFNSVLDKIHGRYLVIADRLDVMDHA